MHDRTNKALHILAATTFAGVDTDTLNEFIQAALREQRRRLRDTPKAYSGAAENDAEYFIRACEGPLTAFVARARATDWASRNPLYHEEAANALDSVMAFVGPACPVCGNVWDNCENGNACQTAWETWETGQTLNLEQQIAREASIQGIGDAADAADICEDTEILIMECPCEGCADMRSDAADYAASGGRDWESDRIYGDA